EGELKQAIQKLDDFRVALDNKEKALEFLNQLSFIETSVVSDASKLIAEKNQVMNHPEAQKELENLQSIFKVFKVRAKELLERRIGNTIGWIEIKLQDLEYNFSAFFNAVEKNAKGRYRIIFNIADKQASDYFFNLEFNSLNKQSICLPDVFVDIMRDLLANARKYTEPGGKIIAGLYESETEIQFVVEDTGQGIPEDEIEKVIDFGYRARNTASKIGMGGGFGLTKAYRVTKKLNGRFWIESKINEGTKITIKFPKQGC